MATSSLLCTGVARVASSPFTHTCERASREANGGPHVRTACARIASTVAPSIAVVPTPAISRAGPKSRSVAVVSRRCATWTDGA
jgi:hypothetical protein